MSIQTTQLAHVLLNEVDNLGYSAFLHFESSATARNAFFSDGKFLWKSPLIEDLIPVHGNLSRTLPANLVQVHECLMFQVRLYQSALVCLFYPTWSSRWVDITEIQIKKDKIWEPKKSKQKQLRKYFRVSNLICRSLFHCC